MQSTTWAVAILALLSACGGEKASAPPPAPSFQDEFGAWASQRYRIGADRGIRWHGYRAHCVVEESSYEHYSIDAFLGAHDREKDQITAAEFSRNGKDDYACTSKGPSKSELWWVEEFASLSPCEVVEELCKPTGEGLPSDERAKGPVTLSADPEERPSSRLPPSGEKCSESDADDACPTCDLVQASIDEVEDRLRYLGIPSERYVLGELEIGEFGELDPPDLPATTLAVDTKSAAILRTVLEGDFESFHDKSRRVIKARKLTTEQLRDEFDNLRLGLMGHMWCDGGFPVSSPSRSRSRARVGFAFTGRQTSFSRIKALDGMYGWSWPPSFKPLGYTALGDHEQLLQKVFEEGNVISGGRGHGYVVLRQSQDDLIELRERLRSVLADFVFVIDMSCDLHWPCHTVGLEYPTLILRDKKTKKVFLTQEGFTEDG